MEKEKVKILASRAFNYGYGVEKCNDLDILNIRFNIWFEEEYNDIIKTDFPLTKKFEDWSDVVQKWACKGGFKPEFITAIGYDYVRENKVIKFQVDIPKEYRHLFMHCSKYYFFCQINESELKHNDK